MKQWRRPELLIPAGSLEVLKTAVIFGADAVYIGGEAYGLRAKAKNFSPAEMAEGIAFVHAHQKKVYVTANILAHNCDLEGARTYFEELRDMKPEPCDALIIADPGIFALAREVWPQVDIHISTQANNTNYRTCLFWWQQGAKRVVTARELSLEEIHGIRERIPEEMEIESFIHGSMCISYSGRCLLSNYFTGRDANQGSCTHPCRWKYAVVEETRPGEYLPVYENERGTYIFNSRDLCMIEHIPEMVEAGINSFKIEGRMKTALYVATAARTYRKALDDYFISEETYRGNMDWYREEIAKCTYRQYSTGFYFGRPGAHNQIYDNSTYVSEYIYLGLVEEILLRRGGVEGGTDGNALKIVDGREKGTEQDAMAGKPLARIRQKNKFSVGDFIEIMKPDGRNVPVKAEAMYNEDGEAVESCPHAGQTIWVRLSETPEPYDILRKKA